MGNKGRDDKRASELNVLKSMELMPGSNYQVGLISFSDSF